MEETYLNKNKKRWIKLPGGKKRISIDNLLRTSDFLFKLRYNYFSRFWRKERDWEHIKYSQLFRNRNVLEIGSGMGYDAMVYAEKSKSYTCAELNISQLYFLKRVFNLYGKNIDLEYLKNPLTHEFDKKFQAFYAHGVLHHVPFEIAQQQFKNIDKYLEIGCEVIFLMYPKERWEAVGKPDFEKFGDYTDGGCPWAEYYDEEKILALVGDGYALKNTIKWGMNNIEFVNYELEKIQS